jgi:3-hydroxyisobutyrate dehydrogenase
VADPIKRVAVLGTGAMGAGMARNIAAAGIETAAWNRTRERAEPLAENGIEVCSSPRGAAEGADAVLTMLSDGDAVAGVMSADVLGALADGGIWVQASTVGADWSDRLAAAAERAGRAFVDAPVSGTKGPAEQGELVVLASGPGPAIERCRGIFDAIGSRTVELGAEPGAASRMKLAINAWLLAMTAGLAEAIALAESAGIDPEAFLATIEGGPLDSPYARMKGASMVARDFEPAFSLALAEKDARLAIEAAQANGLQLPGLEAIASKYRDAEDMGLGEQDLAAVYEVSSQREDARPAAAP